jgi:hypothetical protein
MLRTDSSTTTFRILYEAMRRIVFYNPKATRFRYRRLPLQVMRPINESGAIR